MRSPIANEISYGSGCAPGACIREWSCGGDFVSVLSFENGAKAYIIGDVAGHGIAVNDNATVLNALVKRLIRSGWALAAVLDKVHSEMRALTRTDAAPFATLFLAISDPLTGSLSYGSAGHPDALIVAGSQHLHLGATGPLLGFPFRETPAFTQRTVAIPANAVLVAVTDGITDARPPLGGSDDFFGSTGVMRAFHIAQKEQRDPAQAIYSQAVEHAGGILLDDATVLVEALSVACLPAQQA